MNVHVDHPFTGSKEGKLRGRGWGSWDSWKEGSGRGVGRGDGAGEGA